MSEVEQEKLVENVLASQRELISYCGVLSRSGQRGWFVIDRQTIDDQGDGGFASDWLAGPYRTEREAEDEAKRINARAAIAIILDP